MEGTPRPFVTTKNAWTVDPDVPEEQFTFADEPLPSPPPSATPTPSPTKDYHPAIPLESKPLESSQQANAGLPSPSPPRSVSPPETPVVVLSTSSTLETPSPQEQQQSQPPPQPTTTTVAISTPTPTKASNAIPEEQSQYNALNFWNRIQSHVASIKMKSKFSWKMCKKYPQCLSGKEYVTKLVTFLRESGNPKFALASREQACKILKRMMDQDSITLVIGKEGSGFVDSGSKYYRVSITTLS